MSQKYYDGTKLLSMKDLHGNKPEIYICTTNRTGGKTTYFGRLLINRFLDSGSKFCLVYRYNYELDDISEKFFKDIKALFFPDYDMTHKKRGKGIFAEIFLNDKACGYAISLNNADQIKKYSHLFSDVDRMLMDEFQSETSHYCPKEVEKLISVHTSIARGQGEQVRYVPIYMLSNPVTIINPYYVALGISSRLKSDTKFLRGDGFVMEQGLVESARDAQKTSAFNRAFSYNSYTTYSAEAVYLNDNTAFITKPKGLNHYICTLRYDNSDFALREFPELGVIYCDDKADSTFPNKITTTTADHGVNYVMIKRNSLFLSTMRFLFEHGCFRFKDMRCKEAVLSALSY